MRSMYLIFSALSLILVGIVPAQERLSSVPAGAPIPCNQRSFSIPFEVHNDGSADPPKEIELLYSADRGTRWFLVKRVPIEEKKFDFTAPSDGEYWFIFRTITLSGVIRSANQSGPQLRVLVDTTPQTTPPPPSQESETLSVSPTVPPIASPPNPLRPSDAPAPQPPREASVVPITPPKPPRMQTRSEAVKRTAPASGPVVPQTANQQSSPTLFSPSGEAVPVQSQSETPEKQETPEKKRSVDPLLVEMSRFYDTPLEKTEEKVDRRLPNPVPQPAASELRPPSPEPPSKSSDPRVPGAISGVSLGDVQKQPRIVVRWDIGDGVWPSAYADVLRGDSPQGPWAPIAMNLPNSGEYWWFVTKEDLRPFYVSVRLRVPSGASTSDATRSPIRIEPAMFNSAAVSTLR